MSRRPRCGRCAARSRAIMKRRTTRCATCSAARRSADDASPPWTSRRRAGTREARRGSKADVAARLRIARGRRNFAAGIGGECV
jgi:hypothetical protein